MARRSAGVLLLAGLSVFILGWPVQAETPAPAQAPPAPKKTRGDLMAEQLARPVDFGGFEDPALTLDEALRHLADRFDLMLDMRVRWST